MDDHELLGADAGAESGAEAGTGETASDNQTVVQDINITVDSAALAAEVAVLEEKFDAMSEQVALSTDKVTDKVTGCYCMLLILAVLGLRNVFRSIIRKVRGGTEDV